MSNVLYTKLPLGAGSVMPETTAAPQTTSSGLG